MEDRLPTLKEELDRKTTDAVHAILARLEGKKINQAQASEAVNTLFTAVAGLIDKDVQNVMCAIRDHAEDSFVERVVLVKPRASGGGIAIVERPVGGGKVRLRANLSADGGFETDKTFDLEDEIRPAEAAFRSMETLVNRMATLGWSKI